MIYLNLRFDDPSPLRIVRWKKAYLLPSNQRGFPLPLRRYMHFPERH